MRVAILAALPGELKPLVRNWDRVASPTKGISIWVKTADDDEYIAVCGGMGGGAALRSFAAAEHIGTLDMVLSVGWAGALDDSMKPGHCYAPAEIIDALTGERFSLHGGERSHRLVTTPRVASVVEKRRLRDAYSAVLVDMEAAVVARLAQIRSIPVYCFKGVSDGPALALPDLNPYIDETGQLRLLPFLAYVALHPQYWGSLLSLGRASSAAAKALEATINNFLETNAFAGTQTGAV